MAKKQFDREENWKKKALEKKEKQKKVIDIIDFLMEEHDLVITDLEP